MSIDIQRGAGLTVTERRGNGPDIFTIVDQQRGIQVAELVDSIERESFFSAEFL